MSIEVMMCESFMNATKDVVYKVIGELSIKYGFDSEEAIRTIGLNVKSSLSSLSSKSSKSKEVKPSKVKARFALPYSGELDESCCRGLRQNQGLYTQCTVSSCDSSVFCKSCQTSADKNNGVPEYGTIESRLEAYTEGIEYKDPSGKSPTPYAKIMKKLKLTREEVEEEAGKLNIKINPIHFETDAVKKSGRPALKKKAAEGEVKPKGRPKKAKKVLELAGEEEDLFASLVMSANKQTDSEDEPDEDADTVIMSESEGEEDTKLAAKLAAEEDTKMAAKLAAEEEAKLAAKLAAEEEAKLAAEVEKEAKKKAAEAKKEAERLEKEAEKEAKKKAAEAKKEAERLEKEAKKKAAEAKKEAERLEKEAKKKTTEEKKPKKSASTEVTDSVEEEEEEDNRVRKFEFEGKKYLKSKKSGIIYNMEQDKIGKWNEAKQRIDFDVIEEESCDEYDA